ncbi:LIM and SH3 domain protein 1-like [Strongylocentrotus purpuratus]|uniref:SH3 domain-containing protein n=1 Tax=Strongylocentrotus purpuratus TaxID=7668 RepID=A0A7M7MXS7_STRPU|nr:LIM and SH3 domain protein 1-like [Strongylocentrotus purpuratus]
MKNYKGYNKLPYCNTHYPTTKFTSVADTPENRRLSQQTKNQSNLAYASGHKENLGKFTTVSDDPESLRLKKNTHQASDVTYKSNVPSLLKGQASLPGAPPPSMGYAQPEQYQPPAGRADPPYQPPPPQPAAPVQQPPPQQLSAPPPPAASSGPQYVAVYDYAAADEDEVSFLEGDMIINAEVIDAGWMQGTVKRTGESGMLPSNYVEAS